MNTRSAPEQAHERRTVVSGRTVGAWVAGAALVAPFFIAVPAASAAVPSFPDNLVVFPDRDFITIEGYQDHIGETALIEVTRPNVGVVGSAKGVVAEGDVAFEINHPGGYCWGAGTGLNVTPDIQPGDKVSIKFGSELAGDTTVQGMYVTGQQVLEGDTLTVKGHISGGVDQAQTEQRIIEPALKDTAVGRRDIRAVPGPLTANDGYSSMLEFGADNTFTATYVFTDPEAARLAAAAGGARAMSWEFEDADANRQGLTIAEFGELGGPGMGGCPNGPLTSGPAGPTGVAAAIQTNGDIKLNWTPAKAIPGTPAIEAYRVHAVAHTSTNGERVEIGKRIDNPAATGTTISGLKSGETYDISIVSVSDAGETFPAVPAIPEADSTAPEVTASPAGGTFRTAQELTLSTTEQGAEIYYTTDGTDVFEAGGTLALGAELYEAPIRISASTTVNYAAIDPSGNISEYDPITFTITDQPLPGAATISSTQAGVGSVTVNWSPADPGGENVTVTGYSVQAYTTDGAPAGSPKTTAGDVTTLVYDGLTWDTAYQFTVTAKNANGAGPESEKSAPVTVLGDLVANAGPDQSIVRGTTPTLVKLDGGKSTTTGATYKWQQVLKSATDPNKVSLTGDTTLTPSFTLPIFATPMTNDPLTFRLTVTSGDKVKVDEVQVTPVPDRVAVTSARWKARDFRIEGTGSLVGAVVTIHRGSATGPVVARATVTAVAGATTGTFSVRLRDGAAGTTNPGTLWIESSAGGTAGPITVANG